MTARRQELAAKMAADYKPMSPAKMTPEERDKYEKRQAALDALRALEEDSFSLLVKR